jgi:hypothetical protein
MTAGMRQNQTSRGGLVGEQSDAHRKACCQGVVSTLINLHPLFS